MGSWILPRELNIGIKIIQQYDPCENETQNEWTFPQLVLELEPMQEVVDNYNSADILLYRGNLMTRDHVLAQSCDTNGNIMGRDFANAKVGC